MPDPGYSGPTQHQAFQGVPRLDTPLIDDNGAISIPWYRFLIGLWQRLGSGFIEAQNAVTLQSSGGMLQPVNAVTGQTGQVIGPVVISGTASTDPVVREVLALVPPPDPPTVALPPSGGDPLLALLVVPPGDSFDPAQLVLQSLELRPWP